MSAATTAALSALHDRLQAQVWRASSLGSCASPGLASGFAALDAELPGGGWPTRALSEILTPLWGVLEWRLLAPALRPLLAAPPPRTLPGRGKRAATATTATASPPERRSLLLINPPRTPHLPGLAALGLPPQQLVWIAAEKPQQQLWATEQAIKADAAAAVLAWLPQARPEQIRRLQACALGSAAPVFLLRPWAAQQQSSAAPLRMLVTPGTAWTLAVHLLKRRGPAHEGWLSLPSVPSELAPVLTPRMLALGDAALPSATPLTMPQLAPRSTDHALARPAALPAVQR